MKIFPNYFKKLKEWIKETLQKIGKSPDVKKRRDILNREPHAIDIANEIEKNFGNHSEGYIFAISGKWGEGKTDLLDRLKPKLISKGFNVVLFNPWQYTQDAETLRRAFLKTLKKKLESKFFSGSFKYLPSKRRILDRLSYDESRTSFNFRLFFKLIFLLTSLVIIVIFIHSKVTNSAIFQSFKFLYLSLIDSIKNNRVLSGVLAFIITLIFAPGLFQFQKKSGKVSSVDDFEELFLTILKGHKKVVIFVDDLDRCTPEGVKLVLDTLKTFFKTPKVSYVITGDHSVLERYIGKKLEVKPVFKPGDTLDKEATETEEILEGKRFLQKLFNVYWQLPPIDSSYASQLMRHHLSEIKGIDKNSENKIFNLMSNFLERNPREIERFTKILNFALRGIESRIKSLEKVKDDKDKSKKMLNNLKEVNDNPSLLAKVLLIQEKFAGEFYEYAKQPSRYALLEREQLKNTGGLETDQSKSRLKQRFTGFFSLVKTEPTFHDQRFVLRYSVDVFFYFLGFAGSAEKGILSEDFLSRYINPDQELLADLKGSSESVIKKLIPDSISHLVQLTDKTQMGQAITNLSNIFMDGSFNISEFLDTFISSDKVIEHWKSLLDDQKEVFLQNMAKITIDRNGPEVFKKILLNDPWKIKKESIWSSLDVFVLLDKFIDILVKDLLQDQQNGVDIQAKKQKIFDEHLKIIVNPRNNSKENLEKAINRLNDLADKLALKDLANNQTFKQILICVRDKRLEKEKRILLLQFLTKNQSIWSTLSKPIHELRLLNSRSKLRKSIIKDTAKIVYESWCKKKKK